MMDKHAHLQAEQPLRSAEHRLREFIDGLGPSILVAMLTPDGTVVEGNRSAFIASGLKADEAIGRRFYDLHVWAYSPAVRSKLCESIERAARGEPSRYDVQVSMAGNQIVDADFSLQPVCAEDGTVVFLVASGSVITERKQAERRVQKLNRLYAILSEINETIVRAESAQLILDAACRIAVKKGEFPMACIGLSEGQQGGLRIAAHAGATQESLEFVNALWSGANLNCAFTSHAMLGREHAICDDIASHPLTTGWRDAALARGYRAMVSLPLIVRGTVAGIFNLYSGSTGVFDTEELRLLNELAVDISFALEVHEREHERRQVEQALRETDERFRQLADNIDEVFWIASAGSGEVIYISPAYEKIWGRSCASLYESPSSWWDAVHPVDRPAVPRVVESTAAHASDQCYRIRRPDGSLRWIHARAFPVRDAAGNVIRTVGIAEDITAQRQLEEQYRQAQKMEIVGQLAGGVAHDFNNLLTVIQGYGSLLMMEKHSPEAEEAVEQIVHAAERAAGLTRQLLAFSRRQVMLPQRLDLNQVVGSMNSMLQRMLGETVRLRLNLAPQSMITMVDAGMIDQVIMNLVINARDAMRGGGEICIETAQRVFSDADALTAQVKPGTYACLRIEDTGSGISPEDLPHIFEPFFTTKGIGSGTGLGLSTAFGIIMQHGGTIRVDTALGRGTTMEVLLPAVEGTSMPLAPEAAEPFPRGGSETILIVEDDPHVRALGRVVLERQGYRVLEAAHAPEALRIWDQNGGAIDLVLTDMVMPEGMNGRELAAILSSRKPGLPVVFTSGYSSEIAGRELSATERAHFIQKPSSARQLLETVRRCLDGGDAPAKDSNARAPEPAVSRPPVVRR
jgi:two-component system cell cycle sensor histidine kinase/response regulator CckA